MKVINLNWRTLHRKLYFHIVESSQISQEFLIEEMKEQVIALQKTRNVFMTSAYGQKRVLGNVIQQQHKRYKNIIS